MIILDQGIREVMTESAQDTRYPVITAQYVHLALGVALAIMATGCGRPEGGDRDVSSGPARLFAEAPAAWFEGYGTAARIAPDGRWAIYGDAKGGPRIVDLQSGRPSSTTTILAWSALVGWLPRQ